MITPSLALIGVAALVGLALFLAIVDAALHHSSRISLRLLAESRGAAEAELINRFLEDRLSVLMPLRLGTQAAMVGVTVLLTELFISVGIPRALLLAFFTMLLVLLVFRELLPNIIAVKSPERVLVALLPPFRIYTRLLTPLARPLARFIGTFLPSEPVDAEAKKEDEIQAFIESGQEEGLLEPDEGRMVQSIVDLGDKVVREIMTPRLQIVAISKDTTLAELRELFSREKHSRVPVYAGDLDHVVGLVFAIDLVAHTEERPEASIEPLIRPVPFVPETKRVSELLREFQRRQATLAVVVDEYGSAAGLVTVEDILEEIVGEIHDEFDEAGRDIVREADGVFLVSGGAEIKRLEEELGLSVDQRGFETVSGFLYEILGRVPRVGEVIPYQDLSIEVVDAESHRINKVRFRLPQQESA
jgi:CBS domain containing-hemolysin-like protein